MSLNEEESSRRIEELEAELVRQKAAWTVREADLLARLEAAHSVLDAADERDDLADARDVAARKRARDRDLADFRTTGGGAEYTIDRPERREAALGRELAKGDRTAAQQDRVALTEDMVDPHGDGH